MADSVRYPAPAPPVSDPSSTDRGVPVLPARLAWTGFTVLALCISGAIQFVFAQVPSDADTADHAAVARPCTRSGTHLPAARRPRSHGSSASDSAPATWPASTTRSSRP